MLATCFADGSDPSERRWDRRAWRSKVHALELNFDLPNPRPAR